MNYTECYPGWEHEPKKNDVVLITVRQVSYNSGRDWVTEKTVELIYASVFDGQRGESDDFEPFCGSRRHTGPSWSEGNLLKSGTYYQYCSRYDGKRWRSMK